MANLSGQVLAATNTGTINGTLTADTQTLSGSLSVHWGADGTSGKDGVSPIIRVVQNDEKAYILEITDANGTFLTPNLKGEDGEFAGNKIDEDLEKYRLVNPNILSVAQKEASLLYVRRVDTAEGTKISLSTLALKQEVDEQIQRKLSTQTSLEGAKWKVGDYIFLEK